MNRFGRVWSVRLGLTAIALVWSAVWVAAQSPDTGPDVADVRVLGARRIPEQRVLNEIRTRKGQPYRAYQVREDVRKLDSLQWYYSVAAEEQQTAEGVVVVLRVVERPVVHEVIYEGAKHLTREELEGITGLRKGSPMSVHLNRKAARAIEQHYHEKARLFASVEIIEGDDDDDMRVVFRVTEGPVVRVNDIRFEGNEFVTAGRLKTQVKSSETLLGMGGKYNPELLDIDLAHLIEYYRTFGFFDVKIRRKLEWNPGYRDVDAVFVIQEGVRYLVDGYEVAGAKSLPNEVLLAQNTMVEDKPFDGRTMQVSARKMQDAYGSRGYVNTKVVPELRFSEEPGLVHVVYQCVEGRPGRVGEVIIVGNTVTKQEVILRQVPVYPGQILDTVALRQGERNLDRLRIFTDRMRDEHPSISIIDPEGESEYKNLLVEVEEQRTGTLMLGAAVNSDAGLTGQIILHEINFDITRVPTSWDDVWSNRAFRGAGQEFRVEAMPGTELHRYAVSWREPYLFDTTYSLGTSLYYYTRRFDDYDERRIGSRVTVGHRFTPEWTGSVGIRLEDVKVDDFPFFAPSDFYEVEGHNQVYAPRIALTRDTRDSIIRPTEGNVFEISYEHAFGDFTYPIFVIEDSQYWTVYERPDGSGRHVIALKGQMGIAGDNTPLYDRFYAGGFRTLRGFDYRGVGPDKFGFKVGGDFLLLGSVEYQIPILANDNLYAVVFSDFGTVEEDIQISEFRASVGAGLRIIVPFMSDVPIALDFAYPVVRADTDDKEIFSFFVGFTR